MRWMPCGPHAALIELPADGAVTARARAVSRLLESEAPHEVLDFSIAFDKVLLEFRPGGDLSTQAGEWTRRFAELAPLGTDTATLHEIPVAYEGADLAEIARRHGLGIGELIERHCEPVYEVALLGFSPGFPYLDGLDPKLHTPRRANPRPKIPAGSVAIGGSHTGIYSVESPGGWNLLGTTNVRIFDPARRAPDDGAMFLLRPGDRVKFVPAG